MKVALYNRRTSLLFSQKLVEEDVSLTVFHNITLPLFSLNNSPFFTQKLSVSLTDASTLAKSGK